MILILLFATILSKRHWLHHEHHMRYGSRTLMQLFEMNFEQTKWQEKKHKHIIYKHAHTHTHTQREVSLTLRTTVKQWNLKQVFSSSAPFDVLLSSWIFTLWLHHSIDSILAPCSQDWSSILGAYTRTTHDFIWFRNVRNLYLSVHLSHKSKYKLHLAVQNSHLVSFHSVCLLLRCTHQNHFMLWIR